MKSETFEVKNILLGLSLQEDENYLVKFGQGLCQRLGARLILTHVVRPFQHFAYAG